MPSSPQRSQGFQALECSLGCKRVVALAAAEGRGRQRDQPVPIGRADAAHLVVEEVALTLGEPTGFDEADRWPAGWGRATAAPQQGVSLGDNVVVDPEDRVRADGDRAYPSRTLAWVVCGRAGFCGEASLVMRTSCCRMVMCRRRSGVRGSLSVPATLRAGRNRSAAASAVACQPPWTTDCWSRRLQSGRTVVLAWEPAGS